MIPKLYAYYIGTYLLQKKKEKKREAHLGTSTPSISETENNFNADFKNTRISTNLYYAVGRQKTNSGTRTNGYSQLMNLKYKLLPILMNIL